MSEDRPTAAEFFAGIGLMRAGLEKAGIDVVWSNDIEPTKRALFASNFDAENYVLGDIRAIRGFHLPDVDIATASFPCTDLSLAGGRQGLAGSESSMLLEFLRIVEEMHERRPSLLLLENVLGFATSHSGSDVRNAIILLNTLGYSCDVFAIDAVRFVPQSRPRMFVVGASDPPTRAAAASVDGTNDWLRRSTIDRVIKTNRDLRMHRIDLAAPPTMTRTVADIIERFDPNDDTWWDRSRTSALIESLSLIQLERLNALRHSQALKWRTAYRRTRHGRAVWEIRSDEIAGCLRTARGGSSKQAVVEAGRDEVRVRWMTPREYARLMGAPGFRLGAVTRNQQLFGLGDAVCVPVVECIAREYLLPTIDRKPGRMARAEKTDEKELART